jgi:hypothetical protein
LTLSYSKVFLLRTANNASLPFCLDECSEKMYTCFLPIWYTHLSKQCSQGCQIFLGTIYQNGENIPTKMTTKYSKWPQNAPNDHKIIP